MATPRCLTLEFHQGEFRMPALEIIHAPAPRCLAVSVRHVWPGTMLVARDEHGIRALLLGDDDRRVRDELTQIFPSCPTTADLAPPHVIDDAGLPRRGADATEEIQLAPTGTPFQFRVWRLLCAIPSGETRSYSDIARQLDMRAGARAVGTACSANQIALLIPCHRAVRSDGELSGFRWGIRRKMVLLEREAMARMEHGLSG